MISANTAGAFAQHYNGAARQCTARCCGTDAGCSQHRLEHGSQYNVKWQALSAAVWSLVRHTPPGAPFIILNAKRLPGQKWWFRPTPLSVLVRTGTESTDVFFTFKFDFAVSPRPNAQNQGPGKVRKKYGKVRKSTETYRFV